MPTKKPRLVITVDERTHAVFMRIQKASGKPATTFISEVLSEGLSAFEAMATAMEQAKSKKSEAFETLAHALTESNATAAQLNLAIHEEIKAAKKPAVKKGSRRATT